MSLLQVSDLCVQFPTDDGLVTAVDHVSFSLEANETLGIVGESGSGKSVTSLAILGLLPKRSRVSGSVKFQDQELVGMGEKLIRPIRGKHIAMIFQDALTSLNPVFTVGNQIREAIAAHDSTLSKSALRDRTIELLDIVGIPNPGDRINQYPHEFSGGMRQRAMIAMSIANEPEVLIADEPTTALDVTVQAQILDVLRRIQDRTSSSVIMITHDLGVVAGVADRVLVMYAGRPVEEGSVEDVFYQPSHPYTRGLLASLPRVDGKRAGERLFKIDGQPPSLISLPPGCAFAPRCHHALSGTCDVLRPEDHAINAHHVSSCHRVQEIVDGSLA
jgi:oligopeptide/dipeptide ABC transporter ATP-binding protein